MPGSAVYFEGRRYEAVRVSGSVADDDGELGVYGSGVCNRIGCTTVYDVQTAQC